MWCPWINSYKLLICVGHREVIVMAIIIKHDEWGENMKNKIVRVIQSHEELAHYDIHIELSKEGIVILCG